MGAARIGAKMEPDIDEYPPEDGATVFDGLGAKVSGWYDYLKSGVTGAFKPAPKPFDWSGPVTAAFVVVGLIVFFRK